MFRRRFITDVRYQVRFAAALLRGFSVAVLVPACVLLAAFFAAARGADPQHYAALLSGLPRVIGIFLLAAASFALGTVVLGVYLSHKYIGPLKRVEAWSARFLLGQPVGKLTLRPGDELDGVVAGLARLVERNKG